MDDFWPQRIIFRQDLDDYLVRAKKTQAQFCDEVGIKLSWLRNNLYRTDKRLSLDVLQRASALFGLSVTRWIDDPGAAIAGQDLSNESEQTRFFASLIVKDMRAEDLTDDDRRYLWEDYLRALERLRHSRARTPGGPGADRLRGKPDEDGHLAGAGPSRPAGRKKGR